MSYYTKMPMPRIKKSRRQLASFAGGLNTTIEDNILPLKYAVNTYNFCLSDGALKTGYGLEMTDEIAGEEVWSIFLYKRYDYELNQKDDRLMFFCKSGRIFYKKTSGGTITELLGITLSGKPMAINYRLYSQDVVIICTETNNMLVWDGKYSPYFVENTPNISSMTLHFERLFATTTGDKTSVWFSDDLDPTNWEISPSAGGFIDMPDERGTCNKVVSYQNYVYIFRERGISRITAYADQSEFAVSHLFVSSGRIYPDTVTLCGDYIMFLADDGVYAFNGLSTYKVLPQIDGFFGKQTDPKAAYAGGKFYFALRLNFDEQKIGCENGDYVNNAVIIYDLNTRSFDIMRGVDIKYLYNYSDDDTAVLATMRQDSRIGKIVKNGSVFGQSTKKCWQTAFNDLGAPDKNKIISDIHLISRFDCFVEVFTERGSRRFFVKGSNAVSRIKLNISCVQVGFRFISECDYAEIVKPQITYNF